MRLIDGDTLRERLLNLAYDDWNQGIATSFADACNEIINIVEEQPTIKPERKKGEWIPVEVKGVPYGIIMKCNKCNFETMVNDALYYNYCPNCGWQMMRGDEDEIS